MIELAKILKHHHGLRFNPITTSNKRDILFRTLDNRGIKNVAKFSNPIPNVDFKVSEPSRQNLAMSLAEDLNKAIHARQRISILVDNDADGFTSAAFMYKYLTNFGIKANFIYTPGKNHGIKAYSVKHKLVGLKLGYLIIPDASLSINDIEFLRQWNIPYLIIDHHDLNHQKTDFGNRYHIFNNQWNQTYLNPEFTGVGLVYQFCKLLDQLNHTDFAENYLYLISIGQVSDVSDISDPEIRYYVQLGFKQMVHSRLLKITANISQLSAHELSFSIIPKVNAVCRIGSLYDKNELLSALVDNEPNDLVKISFRRKSKIDRKFHKHFKNVDHYYLEAKQLNRIKAKQKRAVKRSLKALKTIYKTKSFIVGLDKSGQFKQEEAGLIATQLSNKYQRPTIILRTCGKPGYYKGSARGNTQVMKDFRKFCNQTDKFKYALGHNNAFGVMISDSHLKSLLNEYKNVNLNNNDVVYTVDNLYLDNVPSNKEIVDFDNNRDLFGGKVKDPQLGFVGMYVKSTDIKFHGSVLTIKSHGLKFIQFNSSNELKHEIQSHQSDFYFDIVGVPDINRFMSWHYPQIIINNLKIVSSLQNKDKVCKSFNNFCF